MPSYAFEHLPELINLATLLSERPQLSIITSSTVTVISAAYSLLGLLQGLVSKTDNMKMLSSIMVEIIAVSS
jgi:hypothetical protein